MLKYDCANPNFIPLCLPGNSGFVFEILLVLQLFLTLCSLCLCGGKNQYLLLLFDQRGWKILIRISPTTNPPIWAKKATLEIAPPMTPMS